MMLEAFNYNRLDRAYRDTAGYHNRDNPNLLFDQDAPVRKTEYGTYVQCWLKVSKKQVKTHRHAICHHTCMWCGRYFPDVEHSYLCNNPECPSNQE